jgi:hypothetical protein
MTDAKTAWDQQRLRTLHFNADSIVRALDDFWLTHDPSKIVLAKSIAGRMKRTVAALVPIPDMAPPPKPEEKANVG